MRLGVGVIGGELLGGAEGKTILVWRRCGGGGIFRARGLEIEARGGSLLRGETRGGENCAKVHG